MYRVLLANSGQTPVRKDSNYWLEVETYNSVKHVPYTVCEESWEDNLLV